MYIAFTVSFEEIIEVVIHVILMAKSWQIKHKVNWIMIIS